MKKKKLLTVIQNIFRDSFGARAGEKVLVFADSCPDSPGSVSERQEIVQAFVDGGAEMGLRTAGLIIPSAGNHGMEPDRELWKAALGDNFVCELQSAGAFEKLVSKTLTFQELCSFSELVDREGLPDIIAAFSYYSTSHTLFRKFMNSTGCRYGSTPMAERSLFDTALAVDFTALETVTLQKQQELSGHNKVVIRSGEGCDLHLDITGRALHADTGNLKAAGCFGNLPSGEVYTAPVERGTQGCFIAEWAHWGRLEKPLKIYVKDGVVHQMDGDARLKAYLEQLFERDERCRVVAELGIGTNSSASNPANILEAEKIAGTCHIALGDNSTFGGLNRATAHLDFVIFNPGITLS